MNLIFLQLLNGHKENIPPRRPETPEQPFVTKLGSYEDKRKKLQEERQKEYNDLKKGVSCYQISIAGFC